MAGVNLPDLSSLFTINKKIFKPRSGVVSRLPTFDPNAAGGKLTVPGFNEHTQDIYETRTAQDSRAFMREMFIHDSDVSAAVNSYLTLADTDLRLWVIDPSSGEVSTEMTNQLNTMVMALTEPFDMSRGFQLKPDLRTMCEEMRYMALLRGGVAAEMVFDKNLVPDRLENIDLASVEWTEKNPGEYKPFQKDKSNNEVSLDIPNFWVAFHRRDPTRIYQSSNFVSVISSMSARQLVINELYSIMRQTGYSRMTVSVMEEVILKNAPAQIKTNPAQLKAYLNERLSSIQTALQGLKAGAPFIHWDSIKPDILNDRNPGASMDIRPVIDVLNQQQQSSLKTMPTVLGRGTGSQVASVEARYAAMCADQLNKPVAMLLRRAFQFLLNVQGVVGLVHCEFAPAELRPDLELEPQRVMRTSRLKDDLSLGLITDAEYHMMVHGRPAPPSAPLLQGTGFTAGGPEVDVNSVTPNDDPMGQSITPQNAASARSNETKDSSGGRAVE